MLNKTRIERPVPSCCPDRWFEGNKRPLPLLSGINSCMGNGQFNEPAVKKPVVVSESAHRTSWVGTAVYQNGYFFQGAE